MRGINPGKQAVCLGCRIPRGTTVPVTRIQPSPMMPAATQPPPKASAVTGPPVLEKWKCQACGNINPGQQMVCLGCDAPRPDPAPVQSPIQQPPVVSPAANGQHASPAQPPAGAGTNPAGTGVPACPNCHEPIRGDWQFCRWCGAALQMPAPAAVQASQCMNDIFLNAFAASAQAQKTQARQASHYQPSEYAMGCALSAGVAGTVFPG